jgi:outer membrane protein OmpA-like peptidoglycan-associated protein
MRGQRVAQAVGLGVAVAMLTAGIAGCKLVSTPIDAGRVVTAVSRPTSLLVLILGGTSGQVHTAFRDAVLSTVRPGEHVVVVGPSGTSLGLFTAPAPPAMPGPVFPQAPPRGATSFQQARYEKIRSQAVTALRHDRRLLRARQQRALAGWGNRLVAVAWSAAVRQPAQPLNLTRSTGEAMTDLAALEQAGLQFGRREAMVLVDVSGQASPSAALDVALAGVTTAVTGIADSTEDAAWQAALLQAGARTVYALPGAANSLLPALVDNALAGHAAAQVDEVALSYGPAQYALPPTATPSLDLLLRLLTVTYPRATASINGYTDSIPVPGGNLELSWRRADAVLAWLVGHGIAASRLQAIGHGASDPVAPNMPGGQPLNRRVVVIVWP